MSCDRLPHLACVLRVLLAALGTPDTLSAQGNTLAVLPEGGLTFFHRPGTLTPPPPQALQVLDDSARRLQQALPGMGDEDRQLAEFYLERLGQLQEFFRLAQVLLMSLIEHAQGQPQTPDQAEP